MFNSVEPIDQDVVDLIIGPNIELVSNRMTMRQKGDHQFSTMLVLLGGVERKKDGSGLTSFFSPILLLSSSCATQEAVVVIVDPFPKGVGLYD